MGADERLHGGRPGTTDAQDPGDELSDPAADRARPPAPPRVRHRLAAGPRADGLRLPALDRPDPRLAAHVRHPRVRDHLSPPAGDHVAGERAPHRQRGGVRAARAGHAARRLVEPARLVDLRRDRGRRAPVEARDPVPRSPLPEPVELRSRALLPPSRPRTRGSARALVGADVALDGARARDHPRRRARDPVPGAPPLARDCLLDHVRRRNRGDRCQRPRDDSPLAPRPDHRVRFLARARPLARGDDLPLLHDHRPEDDAVGAARAPRLRRRRRARGGAPDRAAVDGVLDEGRPARRTHARLRRAAVRGAARATAPACAPVRAAAAPRGARRRRRRSLRGGARAGGPARAPRTLPSLAPRSPIPLRCRR